MIHSVTSNNPLFKTVVFHPGFNVVLADRDSKAEERNTRNGAGKTTLIEIIHFCLGSSIQQNSVFKNSNLKGWSFAIMIDIGSSTYKIERFVDNPSHLYIDGRIEALGFDLKFDEKEQRYYVTPNIFSKAMLEVLYGVHPSETKQALYPSFRELVSYAIRRNIDGYTSAFQFFSKQKPYSIQACNAYFLNLSIDYAAQFQELKDKKKEIDDYIRIFKTGVIGSPNLNIGELSSEVITKEKTVKCLEEQMNSFRIHPQYEDISKEANDYTDQIHELTNELVLRKQLLNRYESSYHKEQPKTTIDEIRTIYNEAGVLFQNATLKTLEEVLSFHKSLVLNRKEYLSNEIRHLQDDIRRLENEIKEHSDQRAKLMQILKTHGALAEYVLIQERFAKASQSLEDVKRRLETAEQIENNRSRLKIENQELLLKTRQDFIERASIREHAISLFRDNSGFLYPEAGTLFIDLNENGYTFGIEMKNSRSQGVSCMKVFCYDLVLMELGMNSDCFPDFLIHDSPIFDAVDERQFARALMLAKQKTDDLQFQYICMVNSDKVPYQEFDSEFAIEFSNSIVLRISDNHESGGLLGIRF